MPFREAVNDILLKKKRIRTESRTRLREGSMGKAKEQKIDVSQSERKNDSGRKAVPACREASEPLFEERSDAVKVSETLYPTNGSGKNPAKDTRFKYSDLCTHACPYRLAWLGTSFRIRGKRTLRKKEFIFFI